MTSASSSIGDSRDVIASDTTPSREGRPNGKITTVIFDVDDTLYDVSNGFTSHRNTYGATSFMMDRLHFSSRDEAQSLRDEYFARYHSTAKGLTAAESDGRLPPLPDGVVLPPGRTRKFDPDELDVYWSTQLDYALLGGRDARLIETFEYLSKHPKWKLNIVAFSNGPRRYVLRVLDEIGLREYFDDGNVFGVTDVLPHCKPDAGSFEYVLARTGARPDETVMVEDSMKNVRAAKALGMRTILVVGRGRMKAKATTGRGGDRIGGDAVPSRSDAEAGAGDAPDETDASVDAAVEVASEVRNVLDTWLGP